MNRSRLKSYLIVCDQFQEGFQSLCPFDDKQQLAVKGPEDIVQLSCPGSWGRRGFLLKLTG